MDIEQLREELRAILDPEPDPEWSGRDIPHSRLDEVYHLDTSYLQAPTWEGIHDASKDSDMW